MITNMKPELSYDELRNNFEEHRGGFEYIMKYMFRSLERDTDGDYVSREVNDFWAGWCLCIKYGEK